MNKNILSLIILFCSYLTPIAANNGDSVFVRNYNAVRPETTGLSASRLSLIDNIVKEGLSARAYPGCQVLVMKDGKIVYDRTFGRLTYESRQPVNANTIYDLASLTKSTATLFAIMKLYDLGKLHLSDRASDYLRFIRFSNKADITIEQLLMHTSGLPSYLNFHRIITEKKNLITDTIINTQHPVYGNKSVAFKKGMVAKTFADDYPFQAGDSLFLHISTHQKAMERIAETPLRAAVYEYSCINFILLKEIAEHISGMSLDEFLDQEFYTPLQLTHLTYLPLRNHNRADIAPTVRFDAMRNGKLQGFVHDPAAALMGNISGNAGLFGNARNVAVMYQLLLNEGTMDGKRYLSKETCQLFMQTVSPGRLSGLGFAKPRPDKPATNPCAALAPLSVFGHTGYTGNCVWVDPSNQMIFVFLSNRTYPSDGVNKLARMKIRPRIHEQIYRAFLQKIKH
ncbi:MAG: serine hydrolase [Paludibacteraceae bacterium]|nr:serine hydrolase [Paludibacteraceae bacterium]